MKDLRDFVRRWVWMLGSCAIAAAAAAEIVSFVLPPDYRAEASVLVPASASTPRAVDRTAQDYARLVTEKAALRRVIDRLHIHVTVDNLARLVSATPMPNTTIIQVTAESPNPGAARDIANALVADLVSQVNPAQPPQTAGSAPPAPSVVVLSLAETPAKARLPDLGLNTAAGFLAGLLVALAVGFGSERMDRARAK